MPKFNRIILVFLAGLVGTLVRYSLNNWRNGSSVPWDWTLIFNPLVCLLVGFTATYFISNSRKAIAIKTLMIPGFAASLSAYTVFLVAGSRTFFTTLGWGLMQFAFGAVGAWLGVVLAKKLLGGEA